MKTGRRDQIQFGYIQHIRRQQIPQASNTSPPGRTPKTSKQELYPVRIQVPFFLGLLEVLRSFRLKADPRTYKVRERDKSVETRNGILETFSAFH